MGFNYHKHKNGEGQDSMWTSMSDLFLGLSIIFLCLYMTAVLHQGSDGRFKHIENQRLTKEVEDLRQQLKVYNTLKQDYLSKEATPEEEKTYEELMSRLELLQEEQKQESESLRAAANENEKKAQALNKYQQMIRNIVNANMIGKARVKNRDTLLDTKDEVITEKSEQIGSLEQNLNQKKREVASRDQKIENLESNLDKRMKELRANFRQQKMTKQAFERQQAQLRKEAQERIEDLRRQNEKAQVEMEKVGRNLSEAQRKLQTTQEQVQEKAQALAAASQRQGQLQQELVQVQQGAAEQAAKMRADFAAQAARDRAAFEAQLGRERLTGAQKAARESQFRAEAERKARDLEGKISGLEGEKQQLAGRARALEGDLSRAMENLNAKKKLAQGIKDAFQRRGIKADVDPNSGDVLLSFGDQYFDTGKANLKPGMKKVLEKAVPVYAANLFDDPKIAKKIQSVEIIGFASPTFQGRFIDPKSLKPEDRAAIDYNLDLSYNRAKAIFNHVFDKDKMQFQHQRELLPIVKVTGRSFLAGDQQRGTASQTGSAEEYCRVNDCSKQQRVIIKFNLKD